MFWVFVSVPLVLCTENKRLKVDVNMKDGWCCCSDEADLRRFLLSALRSEATVDARLKPWILRVKPAGSFQLIKNNYLLEMTSDPSSQLTRGPRATLCEPLMWKTLNMIFQSLENMYYSINIIINSCSIYCVLNYFIVYREHLTFILCTVVIFYA